MLGVHPVAHEGLPRRALALRNFVFMMRKREIDPAGVNVQRLAEILHRHRGAFDVPARAAFADRRLPEMLSRLWSFPESKVASALFLVAVHIDTRAVLNSRDVNIRKPAVVRKFRDAVVNRAFARIGVRLFL